jgi:hypothetical protein
MFEEMAAHFEYHNVENLVLAKVDWYLNEFNVANIKLDYSK